MSQEFSANCTQVPKCNAYLGVENLPGNYMLVQYNFLSFQFEMPLNGIHHLYLNCHIFLVFSLKFLLPCVLLSHEAL
jgi:hypothetical protein